MTCGADWIQLFRVRRPVRLLFSSGQMDHRQYEFKISQGDMLAIQFGLWMQIFRRCRRAKLKRSLGNKCRSSRGGEKPQWELRETTIADMEWHAFVYIIEFEPPPDGRGCMGCDFMRLLVLMDGTVAKATVKPLSP